MTNTLKHNLVKSLSNFEKNFQPLLESKEIKKIVKVLKENRAKRTKQAEEMLTQPFKEGLANYNREKKALKALYKKEAKKIVKTHCKDILDSYKIPTKVILVEKTNFGDRFKKIRGK